MPNEKIESNLRKGKIYMSTANFLAGLLFFLSYYFMNNTFLLIAGVILIITGIIVIYVFGRIEKRYAALLDRKDPIENDTGK